MGKLILLSYIYVLRSLITRLMCDDGNKDTTAVHIHNIVGVDVNSATLWWYKPFDAINIKPFRSPYDRAALFYAYDY